MADDALFSDALGSAPTRSTEEVAMDEAAAAEVAADEAAPPVIVIFGIGLSQGTVVAIVISILVAIALLVWVNISYHEALTGTTGDRSTWSTIAKTPGKLTEITGWTLAANMAWPIPLLNVVVAGLAQWRIGSALTPDPLPVMAPTTTISFPAPHAE